MANFELIGLNELTPQLVAPTASDVGVIVGSLVVGSSSVIPSGALHIEGNSTFDGNLTVSGSITGNGITSTNDVSLSGNDLILGDGQIQFNTADTAIISQVSKNLHFDVVSGAEHLFIIGTQSRLTIKNTEINMHSLILNLESGRIQFSSTGFRIVQDISNNLTYDVEMSHSHIFKINNAPELTINETEIDVHNKNVIDVLDINAATYTVGGTPGVSFSGAVSNITVVNGIVTAAS